MKQEQKKQCHFKQSAFARTVPRKAGLASALHKDIKSRTAFTLIELVVVMAVIAVLVLLASPKFLNYTVRAKETQIRNDIKVLEAKIDEYLINHEALADGWGTASPGDGQLYDKTGPIGTMPPGEFKVVDRTFYPESNLSGHFYADKNGKVVYEDNGIVKDAVENPTIPSFPEVPVEIESLINEGWIPIASADELNQVRESNSTLTFGKGTKWEGEYEAGLNKNYVQVMNIDLSDYGKDYRGGKGWEPIGRYVNYMTNSAFTGKYNGANHTIENVYIDESSSDEGSVGLWGYADGALFSNIKIKNSYVNGLSGDGVGTLVGMIDCNNGLNELYNIKINTAKVSGYDQAGIVAGTIYTNTNAEYIEVLNSNLDATNAWGAGLFAGYYEGEDGNYIRNIRIEGDVSIFGDGGSSIGGIIGEIYSYGGFTINDVTAKVALVDKTDVGSSVEHIGGFVGSMYTVASLSNLHINGRVEGENYIGGVIGQVYGSGDSASIGVYENIQFLGSVKGNTYVGGLAGYSESYNNYNDISINGDIVGSNFVGGIIGWNENYNTVMNSQITGTVKGTVATGGIIGWNGEHSEISTVVVNADISGVGVDKYGSPSRQIGGVAGYSKGSNITNALVNGTITGEDSYIGGLVGQFSTGIIENSRIVGNIIGGYLVGGITGELVGSSSIESSSVTGNVTGKNSVSMGVGGLVGALIDSTIDNSTIEGTVEGFDGIGGLVGTVNHYGVLLPTISNSYIIGDVSGRNIVGGLLGFAVGSTSVNLRAEGNVTGVSSVGGFVGEVRRHGSSVVYTIIKDSTVKGNVSGKTSIGEIAGTYIPHDRIVFTNNILLGGVVIN